VRGYLILGKTIFSVVVAPVSTVIAVLQKLARLLGLI